MSDSGSWEPLVFESIQKKKYIYIYLYATFLYFKYKLCCLGCWVFNLLGHLSAVRHKHSWDYKNIIIIWTTHMRVFVLMFCHCQQLAVKFFCRLCSDILFLLQKNVLRYIKEETLYNLFCHQFQFCCLALCTDRHNKIFTTITFSFIVEHIDCTWISF